jgi:hypothetical protein
VAARITEEQGKVAAVLAMSPPLETPRDLARSIVAVSKFETIVEHIAPALEALPHVLRRNTLKLVEYFYLLFTALLQNELSILSEADLALTLHDVRTRDPLSLSVRSAREFRFLVEAHSRELELFTHGIAATAFRTGRFFAALIWGEDDTWVPARASEERMRASLKRENTPEDRVLLTMLPARGHGLYREVNQPLAPLTALLERACTEAETRERDHRARMHKVQTFERTLRESARPEPRTDD